MGLRQGPTGWRFLMREVPLQVVYGAEQATKAATGAPIVTAQRVFVRQVI